MSKALDLTIGTEVIAHQRRYRIESYLDLQTVLVRDIESGEASQLKLHELRPSLEVKLDGNQDLRLINDEDWQIAQKRYATIRPLLEMEKCTRADVRSRAQEAGVDVATVYRWLLRARRHGSVICLLPNQPDGGRGKYRVDESVETIIQATIDEFYLKQQQPNVQQTCREVQRRCHNAGIKPPHPNTVRNRIARLSSKEKLRTRRGSKAAVAQYTPVQGSFPGADTPLAVVQIDHTPLDIILVDDLHRRPVGRPWITLAIDVFSRMVTGFYISFDPPGAMSVGLCLAHSILAKEHWLEKNDIQTSWPVWGKPAVVHADNAKEFRGRMLTMACQKYGIDLHWRPVARPHFGGHIERLLGTFNKDIHTLPGSTFSNPTERGEYDSEQQSALTLSEFERWLTLYIVDVYHQRKHSAIHASPLDRYEAGIFGSDKHPGRGLPERFIGESETRLRLDLMPYEERTVQHYGIVIDEINYYHDVLRPWINATDPNDPKGRRKRKFVIRRDPRDISVVYFYDPETTLYHEIPYRNSAQPPISLWELREIRRYLAKDSQGRVDEAQIFEAYNRLRTIEETAKRETKKVRRNRQRKTLYANQERPQLTSNKEPTTINLDDIQPFDDMVELND